ncbi:hypothetical protein L1987_10540 [Smallanthus sonchifolius]|uniref:Uncharacterized protein n=1 Tax=Smallanthus sonchifolius TaxID=185202 RepID=A0ACB9JSD2_9ASTR|nr:hypothetical protein L1987_10540 [Smallanthus sonchifolius]
MAVETKTVAASDVGAEAGASAAETAIIITVMTARRFISAIQFSTEMKERTEIARADGGEQKEEREDLDKEEEQELHRHDSLQVEGRIGALGKLFPLYQKEDGRGDHFKRNQGEEYSVVAAAVAEHQSSSESVDACAREQQSLHCSKTKHMSHGRSYPSRGKSILRRG